MNLDEYRSYLERAAGGLGYVDPSLTAMEGSYVNSADPSTFGFNRFVNDPNALGALFDVNPTSDSSLNPYFHPEIRDAMRQVASRLGLSQEDADRAALTVAQQHFSNTGEPYSMGTHPGIIADQIAQGLFA